MSDGKGWVSACVRAWLEGRGHRLPVGKMEPFLREWDSWMRAEGQFTTPGTPTGSGGCTRCIGAR